jgi:hypothetical protein
VNEPQPVPPVQPVGVIASWVCLCALVNFFAHLVVRMGESEEVAGFLAGTVGGQLGVLTVWAVFGPERLLLRWVSALLAAAFLCGALLVGFVISRSPDAEAFSALLMLPAVFLAAQAPLWILRMVTGWEIVPRGAPETSSAAARQFGLRHLLGATTAVAATLALAKIGFFAMGTRGSSAPAEEWLGLAIACLVAGFWNGLLTIPCLCATMVVKDRKRGCLVVAGYVVVLGTMVPIVMSAIFGSAPPGKAFVVFLSFHGSVALVVVGSLHLLGQSGYVLRRPRAAGTAKTADVAASESGAIPQPPDAPDADAPQASRRSADRM